MGQRDISATIGALSTPSQGEQDPGNTHMHTFLQCLQYKQGSFPAGMAAPFIKPKCFDTWLRKETIVPLSYVAAALLMPHKHLQSPQWQMMPGAPLDARMMPGAWGSALAHTCQSRKSLVWIFPSTPRSCPRRGAQRELQPVGPILAPPPQLTMSKPACGARSTSP